MEPIRKLIGLSILLIAGIPILFQVTWTVGVTRAVSEPEFLPNLPVQLSEELPGTLELFLEAACQSGTVEDEEAQAWFQAAARARTTPSELMEECGLLSWLREGLPNTLRQIFGVLEGKIHPDVITLDLRPLKQAFHHPAVDRYFLEVVENLPPCNAKQQAVWEKIAKGRRCRSGLPPARPDRATLSQVAEQLKYRCLDMPDEEILFEGDEFQSLGMNLIRLASMLSLALFLIPGFFIFAGAFIAEPFNFRFFRWCGIPTMIGGLAVLVTATLPKVVLALSAKLVTWVGSFQSEPLHLSPGLVEVLMEKISSLVLVVIDPLFSPVMSTSLIVCLCGVVLYGLSFLSEKSVSVSGRPPIPRD
jgi:hypothetical protein